MKYMQTNKKFLLVPKNEPAKIVTPFDGENPPKHLNTKAMVSWSHGFTHLVDEEGNITFCGIYWFEDNATELP